MMITINLSQEDISRAIRELQQVQDNLQSGLEQVIDILAQEGADVARGSIGDMATVSNNSNGNQGVIQVSGRAAVIQEFGAGDLTMGTGNFENEPGVPVYPGSYSETEGSGEYAATGKWHFGGEEYQYIDPRMGLFNAKEWIIDHSARIAQEVIRL